MNLALKVGLIFQAVQFGLLGIGALVWILTKINITPLAVLIFMIASLNIASLILIISGIVQETSETN